MLKNYFKQFKQKWNIESNWQLTKIMIVFSLAGQSILFVMPFIKDLFGLANDIIFIWKLLFFIFVSFPIYQILLLFWSIIFGELRFFIFFIKSTFAKTASFFRESNNNQ
jgi:uncharacterized membrane protein